MSCALIEEAKGLLFCRFGLRLEDEKRNFSFLNSFPAPFMLARGQQT